MIDRYRRPGQVDDDLAALRAAWDERLGTLQVATGDEHVDRMVNTWNPYQCMVTFNLSRSASMFESGIGRGMGFRDSNQDLLGFVHMVPERARARILDIAATQLPDGGAYHQYQPLTKRGNHDVGSGFNDDPRGSCSASPPTSRRPATSRSSTSPCQWDNAEGSETPLHDHLRRCIDFTLERLGPARAAAHRAGGLERLPQPQRLLGPARRVLPDGAQPARRRRRVRVHRRPVRARRARGGGDRPPARRRGRGLALRAAPPRR